MAGVILVLFLTNMALARSRFSLPGWTVLFDQVACLAAIPFWPGAWYGLALPLFEAMLKGKPWFALPVLITMMVYSEFSLPLIGVLIQAVFVGWAIRGWSLQTDVYRQEADRERRDRYELENLKAELLLANVQVARTAELSERNRIAQNLHDHVGHELTGTILALQAFEQLWKEGNPQANELFSQVQQRISDSALHLRETVHDLTPVKAIGIGRLEKICREFTACPVNLKIDGDTSKVPVYLWSVLEPCLKEALTNVARHAQANQVNVSLDVSAYIVRLYIHNDGIGGVPDGRGTGLRNLRQRARAVGGSVSTSVVKDAFQLVCVLPIRQDD